ncbi:MAG: thiamine phosphate synthase [Alphaproteobacteria bacterium]|nr:thiamine phosphate synthase [Alphaproteobacteria bacterium]
MKIKPDLSVYFVADPSACGGRDVVDVVRAALRGGVALVQYRNKDQSSEQCLEEARAVLDMCRAANIPCLINDHVELAAQIDADGVHIGQGDMSAQQARAILEPGKIIGITAFTDAHFAAINPEIIAYCGTGPVYPTLTDKGKPVMGINRLADFVQKSSVPVVGIGGITPESAPYVFETGAAGVAIMRGIGAADDPEQAARAFADIARRHKEKQAA